MEFTAKQLAQILKGTVDGDESAKVTSFAKIEHGKPGQLCFYANPKYEQFVYSCKASVLLVNKDFEPKETVNVTMVRVDNAYTALAALLKYVASSRPNSAGKCIWAATPMWAIMPRWGILRRFLRMSISGTIPILESIVSFIRAW